MYHLMSLCCRFGWFNNNQTTSFGPIMCTLTSDPPVTLQPVRFGASTVQCESSVTTVHLCFVDAGSNRQLHRRQQSAIAILPWCGAHAPAPAACLGPAPVASHAQLLGLLGAGCSWWMSCCLCWVQAGRRWCRRQAGTMWKTLNSSRVKPAAAAAVCAVLLRSAMTSNHRKPSR